MQGMDLKHGRNSHEYTPKADENRVGGSERKSASETREACILYSQ